MTGLSHYHSGLNSLIKRLEAVQVEVNATVQRNEDDNLVQALRDGTYGEPELDILFDRIKRPFVITVTLLIQFMIIERFYYDGHEGEQDPFYQAVRHVSNDIRSPDATSTHIMNLVNESLIFTSAFEKRGRAQIGLMRRVIDSVDFEPWQESIRKAVASPGRYRLPQVNSDEECAQLMRLIDPIERDHDVSLLIYTCPSGIMRSSVGHHVESL